MERQNYHLLTQNQVTRVITNSDNGTVQVTGVEFATSVGAERHIVHVKKEAILAAGALHTPQLLQLSGIGDAKLLKSINVSTIIDLPAVGHNLHDHVNVAVVNVSKSSPSRTPCERRLKIGSKYHASSQQLVDLKCHFCSRG